MFFLPLLLELNRGEIPQRGMDPLAHIHLIQESPDLPIGVGG